MPEPLPGVAAAAKDFDPGRLRDFLVAALPGLDGPMRLQRIAGGQSNPTYFVDFPDQGFVLRKRPNGPVLPSAHAIDREFRVLQALAETKVPVPRAILFHAAEDVVGTSFYLMERLAGRVVHDGALPGFAPHERRSLYLDMAETLAKLHAVDPDAVGLTDFGRPTGYFARQIARWSRQWHDSPNRDIPALDALIDWLPSHLPPEDGIRAIAHGDFRLGNLIVHPTEPRIVGVLDWELATLGHPLADLGFCCMAWHTTPQEYAGIRGLDHAALGIPSEAEFVAQYRRHAGAGARLAPFHLAFALFRFAVIFVGIADRARAGSAASENAAEVGRLARHFAERALAVAEGRDSIGAD